MSTGLNSLELGLDGLSLLTRVDNLIIALLLASCISICVKTEKYHVGPCCTIITKHNTFLNDSLHG